MATNLPGLGPEIDDRGLEETADERQAARRHGRPLSRRQLYVRRFFRNAGGVVGLVIFVLLAILALWGVLAIYILVKDFQVGLPVTIVMCLIAVYVVASDAAFRLLRSLHA